MKLVALSWTIGTKISKIIFLFFFYLKFIIRQNCSAFNAKKGLTAEFMIPLKYITRKRVNSLTMGQLVRMRAHTTITKGNLNIIL